MIATKTNDRKTFPFAISQSSQKMASAISKEGASKLLRSVLLPEKGGVPIHAVLGKDKEFYVSF